jgi:hypothetical protein
VLPGRRPQPGGHPGSPFTLDGLLGPVGVGDGTGMLPVGFPGAPGVGLGTGLGVDMPLGAPGLVGPGFGLLGPGTPGPVPVVPDVPLDPEPDAPLDDPPDAPPAPPACAKLKVGAKARMPAVNSVRVALTISALLRRNRCRD